MSATARHFEFVAHDARYVGATPAIGCDGLVPGAALDLTHWQGNQTPRAFKADTSTEIALNFAASPEAAQWAGAVIVNNHFDTDGVLSAWTLLEPNLALANQPLLIAAAEAGDFDEWPALVHGLWLDAAIRALAANAGAGADDDAAAYEIVLPQIRDLLHGLDQRRDLWGSEWEQLQGAVQALDAGRLRASKVGTTGVLAHARGESEAPGPLLSRQFLPGCRRYLLAFEQGEGRYLYRYERPRYAWAETVVRPPCPAPDAERIAAALGPHWTAQGLPGMTGIVQTAGPIARTPHDLLGLLAELDP